MRRAGHFIKEKIKELPFLRDFFRERDSMRLQLRDLWALAGALDAENSGSRAAYAGLLLQVERLSKESEEARCRLDTLLPEYSLLLLEVERLRKENEAARCKLDTLFPGNPAAAVSIASLVSITGDTAPFENLCPAGELHSAAAMPGEQWLQFDDVRMERSLLEYAKRDPWPIPATGDREGYFGPRHYHYWLSGLKDYLLIRKALGSLGIRLEAGDSVLDLGCASGRVIRHLACQEDGLELWGADINGRHIEWVRNFLPPSLRIFQSTVLPQLPLEDNSLSLVYAFSVFTHIDEYEAAWLAEIRRVLKKGAIAYITIHSDNTWADMESAQPLLQTLLDAKEYIAGYEVSPELFDAPMPKDKTVFKWATANVYNTDVFHSIARIRDIWGRVFDVVDIIRAGHNYQDVVILRK